MTAPASQRQRLDRYAAFVLAHNARVNLTGARDAAEMEAHIADALAIADLVEAPLIDVGSGAGLPGIPLGIATGVAVTLVESVGKKARFLREAVAQLELSATVVEARAEVAAHDPALRNAFGSATARAVATLPTVLELTLPFLAPGGIAILQRGAVTEDERIAAGDAARMLGGEIVGEIEQSRGRHIVLVRKTGETPNRFPRRTGVPEKRPLCLGTKGTAP